MAEHTENGMQDMPAVESEHLMDLEGDIASQIPEDSRLSSGVPDEQRIDDLDFIQMSGLTRGVEENIPAEPDVVTPDEDMDPTRPVSFYEKGVSDVDADISRGITDTEHGNADALIAPSQSIDDLKSIIDELSHSQPLTPSSPVTDTIRMEKSPEEPERDEDLDQILESPDMPEDVIDVSDMPAELQDDTDLSDALPSGSAGGETADLEENAEIYPAEESADLISEMPPEESVDTDIYSAEPDSDVSSVFTEEVESGLEGSTETFPADDLSDLMPEAVAETADDPEITGEEADRPEAAFADETTGDDSETGGYDLMAMTRKAAAANGSRFEEAEQPETVFPDETIAADSEKDDYDVMALTRQEAGENGSSLEEAEQLLHELESQPVSQIGAAEETDVSTAIEDDPAPVSESLPEAVESNAPERSRAQHIEVPPSPLTTPPPVDDNGMRPHYPASPGKKHSRRSRHRIRRYLRRGLLAAALLLILAAAGLAWYQFLYPMLMPPADLLTQAGQMLSEGEYQKASEAYLLFARQHPGNPQRPDAEFDAAFALQMTPTSSRDQARAIYQRALELFQSFIQKNPGHLKVPRAQVLTGVLQYELGNYEEVIRILRDPSRQMNDPDAAVTILRTLARAYARTGNFDQAESTWLQAAVLPKNYTADVDYLELGNMYLHRFEKAGEGEEAASFSSKAVEYWKRAILVPGIDPAEREEINRQINLMSIDTGNKAESKTAAPEETASGAEAEAGPPPVLSEKSGPPPAETGRPDTAPETAPGEAAADPIPEKEPDPAAEAQFMQENTPAS